jgi:hypothetical protein
MDREDEASTNSIFKYLQKKHPESDWYKAEAASRSAVTAKKYTMEALDVLKKAVDDKVNSLTMVIPSSSKYADPKQAFANLLEWKAKIMERLVANISLEGQLSPASGIFEREARQNILHEMSNICEVVKEGPSVADLNK